MTPQTTRDHANDHARRRDDQFVLGLLAGAAFGGGLALLFAPREGAQVRHGLTSGAQRVSRRLADAAGNARVSAKRLVNARGRFGRREAETGMQDEPYRDRAADPVKTLEGAIGEATYRPAHVEGITEGPGATSPAPADPVTRSPLS